MRTPPLQTLRPASEGLRVTQVSPFSTMVVVVATGMMDSESAE